MTLRERDTMWQIRLPLSLLGELLRCLCKGSESWQSAFQRFPHKKSLDMRFRRRWQLFGTMKLVPNWFIEPLTLFNSILNDFNIFWAFPALGFCTDGQDLTSASKLAFLKLCLHKLVNGTLNAFTLACI